MAFKPLFLRGFLFFMHYMPIIQPIKHENKIMDERLIQAFYYAAGGIFLGILIAIAWSYAVDSHASPVQIIFITALICGLLGFLFPKQIPHWFRALWNFFS